MTSAAEKQPPKTPAQRVRESESRKREKGMIAVKVWVPDNPEDREALRIFAARLVVAKDETPTNG